MMKIFNFKQIITDPAREARDRSTVINNVCHPRLYISRGVLPIGLHSYHLVRSVWEKVIEINENKNMLMQNT